MCFCSVLWNIGGCGEEDREESREKHGEAGQVAKGERCCARARREVGRIGASVEAVQMGGQEGGKEARQAGWLCTDGIIFVVIVVVMFILRQGIF